MTQLASSYAARFDGQLREAAQIAQSTAGFMTTAGMQPEERIYRLLEQDVRQSHLVYGACLAFEPGTVKPAEQLFAPYVCRAGSGLRRVNIDASVYDWYRDPQYTWFTAPKSLGRPVWSDPYHDIGAGNILMATYSVPFQLDGKFGGIATVDIDLPRLHKTIGMSFGEEIDFVILTNRGQFVYHPDRSYIMKHTIFDIAETEKSPVLAALGHEMLKGSTGVSSIKGWDSDQKQWVFYAPIESANWVFATRFPESRILADVRRNTARTAAALGITLLLIVGCIMVMSRLIVAPLVQLSNKVLEVGRGNLNVRVGQAARSREIRQLATSFNSMTSELRSHVQRLADEQAARQRIEHDLDLAREIQRGLLPVRTPDVEGYEIVGWSQPADKTGGDYYDWQVAPDGRILVTLADVTGHGVGPALVTAVCRAYVRASFATGHDLPPLMDNLNDLLVADLPAGRFVTFAAAMIDPVTHRVEMLSAGHGPIFHYVAKDQRLIEHHANDLPLGLVPAMSYAPSIVIDLQPGDLLLFLTDGFYEWPRSDDVRFGLDRLRAAVLRAGDHPLTDVIGMIHSEVRTFTNGVPQDDDVTAVAIRRAA